MICAEEIKKLQNIPVFINVISFFKIDYDNVLYKINILYTYILHKSLCSKIGSIIIFSYIYI